ncbi:MAG: carboxypeptidase regulatory-like domain-containing protein, partial [Deltaproteobacteria bacterium]|nr:carboxypeptidase regulatory-like domain-containing protein [Deltaproteobacteria bacterium]
RMRKALFPLLLITAFVVAPDASAKFKKKSLNSCAAFTTHEEIGDLLAGYAETYPEIARSFVVGTSVDGREMWALRLSADPDEESVEPEIRIIGSTHGDECIGADTVLEIIEWLVTGYGDEQLPSDLIDGTDILFVPLINPDGYVDDPAHRENSNGVDLNRNMGFAWNGGGDYPFSEPETIALRDFSQAASFNLGLTYHTVAPYVNGPWNYTPHYPLDEDLCQAIGDAYAGSSSYNVVFGWDWYGINGDVNDWSLGTQGTFDWTIEMMSDNNMQWGIHGPGVAAFLEWIFVGTEGTVTDADTGDPLFARILVDPAGEPVFSDPDLGDYHRILMPGTYDVTAVANGYEPATVTGVVVPDGDTVTVDFELEPGDDYAALQINRMIMPEALPNMIYEYLEYQNHTRPAAALGVEDGVFYSMSPGGSITLDMGPSTFVTNLDGPDLLVLSGTGSDDPATVLVAADQDGPFTELASGTGDIEIDLADAGVGDVRFVRLEDDGNGPFNNAEAGYDLDAVINLSPPPATDSDTDVDSDSDTDVDSDSDTDVDSDTDADTDTGDGPQMTPGSAGCGCSVTRPNAINLLSLLL